VSELIELGYTYPPASYLEERGNGGYLKAAGPDEGSCK